MARIYIIGLVSFCLSLLSCVSGKSQLSGGNNSSGKYQEDLSLTRIKYPGGTDASKPATAVTTATPSEKPVQPTNDITKALDAKLDAMNQADAGLKLAQGYRVIVYSGSSNDEAKKIKQRVSQLLPDNEVYTIYKQPTFRVKVGDFFDRLEANNAYIRLKKEFPDAKVVPDQINIIAQ